MTYIVALASFGFVSWLIGYLMGRVAEQEERP